MDACQAIDALLRANAGVLAAVGLDSEGGVKVYPLLAPQGTKPPYIVYKQVDGVLQPVITAVPPFLWQDRIQLTAVAMDYATVKAVLKAAAKACNYQSGTIGGVPVSSIVKETVGGDIFDIGTRTCEQSCDLMVLYFDTGS